MRAVLWVYRFVVGDPVLLWGSLAVLALAYLLRGPLGFWDGVWVFVGEAAVLGLSLVLRPDK
jgi:hypothetical protein